MPRRSVPTSAFERDPIMTTIDAMDLRTYFTQLARYHAWATRRLFESIDACPNRTIEARAASSSPACMAR
jgi:hypothetical protein